MSKHIRHLAVLIAFGATMAFTPRLSAQAASSTYPTIQRVVAIEETNSVYGRYRVVFQISAPLPAPRGAVGSPNFYLGNQVITFSGNPRDATLLFGYVPELPDAQTTLRAVSPMRAGGASTRQNYSDIPVQPRQVLAASRLTAGDFEPPHVRRSDGTIDVWHEWNSAKTVFTADFVRRDMDPVDKGIYRLTFQAVAHLRGAPTQNAGAFVVFRNRTPAHDVLELGGRYVLFANAVAEGQSPGSLSSQGLVASTLAAGQSAASSLPMLPSLVRLWWPQNDFVLDYLSVRAAQTATGAKLRDFLVRELTSNPAAEVRQSAVNELLSTTDKPARPTAEQMQIIQSRATNEPSPKVKSAISNLLAQPPAR